MLDETAPIAERVAAAPARTIATGTARLFVAGWAESPAPESQDERCVGVTDFAGRRTQVTQVLVPESLVAAFTAREDSDVDLAGASEPREMIYDGANAFIRVADRWTGFFLGDRAGPRRSNDPLWPLEALFGARDDVVEIGPDAVRGVATTHCRLTVDLARADAAVPAGVNVPAGPYRVLTRMPAEVWLDTSGLIRRAAVNSELATDTDDPPSWAIVELWDFGVAVDITPPRPDEVAAPRDVDWEAPVSSA